MAKVYSWEITKSNVYAYIIDPNNIEGMGVYIGPELYGNDLNKVVNWTSSCSNEQYKIQFNKIKSKCEEDGYIVIFEDVENYLNVKASCENLRGPAGKGISHIRLIGSDAITRKNTYAIYYDDNTYDTIEIQNGTDGKDGINGEPGTNGFDGVSSKFIMIYSVGIEKDGNIIPPEQPTGGTYNFITNKIEFNIGEQNLEEQGWGTDNNLNGVIYMSSRTFTSSNLSTDNEWSIPVRISGEQGIPGKDGSSIEFIYNLTNQEPNVLNLESPNESGYVPSVDGWTGSPSGVDENNTKEWCSIRTYNNDKNEWGEWQKATIWSNYGVNGQDGDGVQYIYYRTMNSTPPKNPTPYNYIENEEYQNVENEWFPSKNTTYTNIHNELIKFDNDWEDNPKGVDINYQYEWVVTRKYRKNNSDKKNWTSFSNPSLWAKFGADGSKGQIIYPMGVYDTNEVYTTTSKKAPYVIDSNDGLYYVLNKEMTWVGSEHNNITPSIDYDNNSSNGTNCWDRFESFDALYASVGIIKNGTIGSAVYNGKYMFSQQGVDDSGNISPNYQHFNPSDPFNIYNSFTPNICINFENGEMWVNNGNMSFTNGSINLRGFIKKIECVIPVNMLEEYFDDKYTHIEGDILRGELDVSKIGSYIFFTNSNVSSYAAAPSTDNIFKYIFLPSNGNPYFNSLDENEKYIYITKLRSLIGNSIYIYNNWTINPFTQQKFILAIGNGNQSSQLEPGYVAKCDLVMDENSEEEKYIWKITIKKSVLSNNSEIISKPIKPNQTI